MKSFWRLIPIFCFTLLVLFFWKGLKLEPHKLPSSQIGKPLPQFELQSLNGEGQFSNELFKGKTVLLNVFASWCAACMDEQSFLMHLSRGSIPIYGLNYKDKQQNALAWLKEWGNPYKSVGEDREGRVAIDLGVYGAPETFLIDKNGIIRYRHVGVLNEQNWDKEFLPLIKELEASS